MTSLVYPIQALVLGLVLIELLRQRAKELDLLDRPNHRKLHAGEVPLVGGIAIFGAVVLSSAAVPELGGRYAYLFLPALFLVLIGLADDARDLRPVQKLLGQILVAILVVGLNPRLLLDVGFGAPNAALGSIASWTLTVIVLVGTMNAFNMMDGIDGLAGAVSCTALCWLSLASAAAGQSALTMMSLQVLMAVIAFLYFNARAPWRRRASVFLGDSGSLLLGFCIAVFGLELAGPSKSGWSALALCFIVALPSVDTVSLIFRRLWARRSPLSADREHLHHLIERAGATPGETAGVLTLVSVVVGGLGLLLDLLHVGSLALLGALIGLFVIHAAAVGLLRRRIAAREAQGARRDAGSRAARRRFGKLAVERTQNPGTAKG
jgi:UDP-GlcNAc:undecaprenyl-phosphate GlcNAc-1-phosphate transferase